MTQSDLLSQAVELDMVEAGWEPTANTYLNRVPRVRILEAVREAKGEGTAQLLDHLKKGEIATESERLLKGRGRLSPFSTPSRPKMSTLPLFFLTSDLPSNDASMVAAK